METLKYKGEELTLKFGVKALRGIEKETGKQISDLGVAKETEDGQKYNNFSFEEIIVMLKHGLGNIHTDEQLEEIMDENNGCFLIVAKGCLLSYNKAFDIGTAGNLESPQA